MIYTYGFLSGNRIIERSIVSCCEVLVEAPDLNVEIKSNAENNIKVDLPNMEIVVYECPFSK